MQFSPHRRQGFTLIEIMVIIMIATVLVTLVFATSRRVMARANEARCAHNLRSLYQGFMLYANDYNGKLPFGRRDPDVPDINSSYYGGQYGKEFKAYIPGGNPGANTGYAEPYLCPSDLEPRSNTTRGFYGHSYGVNMTICRDEYNRVIKWKYPARTFLLADSKKDVIARSSPNINLEPRHRDGVNTLFLDGHVEWRPAPFPTWSEDRGFWVPDHER